MKKLHLAAIALLLFALNGCASGYPLMFTSNPPGATVVCDDLGNLGYTPTTPIYLNREKVKTAFVDFSKCSATWVSGAKAKYQGSGPMQEVMQRFPNGTVITVERPNVRGHQQDAEFALKVQTMQAAQRQAVAAESQAAAAHAQAAAAQQQAAAAVSQALSASRPRNCITNFGMTTCY